MDRTQTRSRIVAKATEEILRQGYSTTTMDTIAAALGMSKKTIYQLFPSKKDLLKSVLSDLQSEIERELEEIVFRTDLGFRGKWVAVVECNARQYARFGPSFVDDLRESNQEIFQMLDGFRSGLARRCIATLAREGVAEGVFRPDVDPRFLSEAYLAIVQAILNPDLLSSLGMAPDEAYREVVKLLLDGVMRPTASGPGSDPAVP